MFADGLACRVPSAYEPGGRFGASRLDPPVIFSSFLAYHPRIRPRI